MFSFYFHSQGQRCVAYRTIIIYIIIRFKFDVFIFTYIFAFSLEGKRGRKKRSILFDFLSAHTLIKFSHFLFEKNFRRYKI